MSGEVKTLLAEHGRYIISQYRDHGRGTSSLGKEFGCSSVSVYRFLAERGVLDEARRRTWSNSDPSLDPDIARLHAGGKSVLAISRELGITRPAVLHRSGCLGLSFKKNRPRIECIEDRVLTLFDAGNSLNTIAGTVGYNQSQITRLVKARGRRPRTHTHEVDVSFFERIDTEAKAYVLGLWYADGNVHTHISRIESTDLDLLEQVKMVMGYTGPIPLRTPRKTPRKDGYVSRPTWVLRICRKQVADDLKSKGCVPRKSLVLTFPGRSILPRRLVRHFIRGYFDGDGCLGFYRNSWVVQIVGTREFLQGLSDSAGIAGYWNRHARKRGNNTWGWNTSAKADVRRFLDWVYKDATIYLGRKHALYLRMKAGS